MFRSTFILFSLVGLTYGFIPIHVASSRQWFAFSQWIGFPGWCIVGLIGLCILRNTGAIFETQPLGCASQCMLDAGPEPE